MERIEGLAAMPERVVRASARDWAMLAAVTSATSNVACSARRAPSRVSDQKA